VSEEFADSAEPLDVVEDPEHVTEHEAALSITAAVALWCTKVTRDPPRRDSSLERTARAEEMPGL
jgi:hypothetical protein